MSTQAATRFLEKLASDEALRAQLLAQGKDRKQRIDAFLATGRKHGFEFGEEDAMAVLGTARKVGEGVLDERELVAVSGGGAFRTIVGTIWSWFDSGGSGDSGGGNSALGVRG